MKTFNLDELSKNNGKNGQPSYIAHKGRVYDVTGSNRWKNGQHMKRHQSGNDLTTDLSAAPHGEEMLERYPQIGILETADIADEMNMPVILSRLIEKFPFLRRHPHPMTVHFPIVFMISATVFSLLYLITGVAAFDTTAFHCLGGGVLFIIVAISTGLYTWWLNYLSKPTRQITIKKRLSPLLLAIAIIAFILRWTTPDILTAFDGWLSTVYLVLVLSLFPMVSIIGWFGAQLTFPVEGE